MDKTKKSERWNFEVPEDYNTPDRSRADFYCRACDAHIYNKQNWADHVGGKRHLKNVAMLSEEHHSPRLGRISKTAQIMDVLKDVQKPIIGLRFITEYHRSELCVNPSYACHLCQSNLTWSAVVGHILDTKHRLTYIKAMDRNRHDDIVSLELSRDNLDMLVEDQAAGYEREHGQGTMEVKIEKSWTAPQPPKRTKMDDITSPRPSANDRRHERSRSPQLQPSVSYKSKTYSSPNRRRN